MNEPTDPPATERSARARNIATGARSLPEPLRRRFVENACRDDHALRAEVERLLGWTSEAPEAPAAAPEAADEPPAAAPPPAGPPLVPPPPHGLADDAIFDRTFDEALVEEPATTEPTTPPGSRSGTRPAGESPSPRARRTPVLLLLATAALVWLAFIAFDQSRRLAEVTAERDRARIAEVSARAAIAAAQEEAARAREVSVRLGSLMAGESPEMTWRDRVGVWKVLDRATDVVEADSTIGPEARARLLEAIAGAYRGHRLESRADSLLDRARLVRAAGSGPSTRP